MANYGTTSNYVRCYGGTLSQDLGKTTMSDTGSVSLVFTRAVHYPRELMTEFDLSYIEQVPLLEPTDAEKASLDTEH